MKSSFATRWLKGAAAGLTGERLRFEGCSGRISVSLYEISIRRVDVRVTQVSGECFRHPLVVVRRARWPAHGETWANEMQRILGNHVAMGLASLKPDLA